MPSVTNWGGAANCRSNRLLLQAIDGRMVRCNIISSCQTAANSKTVKALLAMSHHVRSTSSSTLTSSAVIQSVIRGSCYVLKMATPSGTRSAAIAVSLPSVLRGASY